MLEARYESSWDHVEFYTYWQERTQGGGGEGPGPPWDLKKHYIFRVSSVKLRDLHL